MKTQFSFVIQHNLKISKQRPADIEAEFLYLYVGFVTFIYIYIYICIQICSINWSYKICIIHFVHDKISGHLTRSEFRGSLESEKRHGVYFLHLHYEWHTIAPILKSWLSCISVCSLSPGLLPQMSSICDTSSHPDTSSTNSQDKLNFSC